MNYGTEQATKHQQGKQHPGTTPRAPGQGQSKHISLGSKPKHGPWMAYFEFDINTNILAMMNSNSKSKPIPKYAWYQLSKPKSIFECNEIEFNTETDITQWVTFEFWG